MNNTTYLLITLLLSGLMLSISSLIFVMARNIYLFGNVRIGDIPDCLMEFDGLNVEIDRLKRENTRLSLDAYGMGNQIARHNSEKIKVASEISALAKAIDELNKVNTKLDEENTAWIESNDSLEIQIDGLMAQNKNLMDELENAKAEPRTQIEADFMKGSKA